MENSKKPNADQFNVSKSSIVDNSRSGIKLLLSMKETTELIESNPNKYESEEYDEFNSEEVLEEMNEEEFSKTVQELDHLLLNIIKTKQKLRLRKLKEQIKTREDCLRYFNVKDKDDLGIPPEPAMINSRYINYFKINNNSKTNQDFNCIKDKLKIQEQMLCQKVNDALSNSKNESFIVNNSTNSKIEEDLYDEIKLAQSKCDDLLDDIDAFIKMGEELSK